MRNITLSILALAGAVGCGGPSDSDKLSELSLSEAKDLCHEMVDLNPERSVTCNGQTFTVGLNDADCDDDTEADLPPDSCTATVGDARDCNEAQGDLTEAQICSGTLPAACQKLAACSDG